MPLRSRRSSRVLARWSNAASSSNEPGTNWNWLASRCQTSSRHGVRAPFCAASYASDSKSPSPQSRRAKPSTTKPGGSRPRLARSYTAGMSFFRERSPVTPKITRAHGSGIRGSRRSCAVRSGLPTCPSCQFFGVVQVSKQVPGEMPAAGGTPRQAAPSSGGVARAVRARRGRLQRLVDALQQLVPTGLELLDALVLEHLDDVVEVDTDRGQVGHGLLGR